MIIKKEVIDYVCDMCLKNKTVLSLECQGFECNSNFSICQECFNKLMNNAKTTVIQGNEAVEKLKEIFSK